MVPSVSPEQSPTQRLPGGKLSYKEQRELATLLPMIEALEREQLSVRSELANNNVVAQDPAHLHQLYMRDAAIDGEILGAMERWDGLSARQEGS